MVASEHDDARDAARLGPASLAHAVLLVLVMVIGCLSIWTLSPMLWLWVASQVDSGGPPTMQAIFVVVGGILVTSVGLAKLLASAHKRYRAIGGARHTVKVHLAWLRASSGERRTERSKELTVLDVILITSVVIAAALYEYWFTFRAGSSIDLRSGR
jgi:hypothetical protein